MVWSKPVQLLFIPAGVSSFGLCRDSGCIIIVINSFINQVVTRNFNIQSWHTAGMISQIIRYVLAAMTLLCCETQIFLRLKTKNFIWHWALQHIFKHVLNLVALYSGLLAATHDGLTKVTPCAVSAPEIFIWGL